MEHFYDAQIKRYLTQFMRLMSNFGYKDSKGKVTQVPVRYGDMNRMVAQIINKNSENVVQSAPFIACYIKNLSFDRERLQDPTFVSKISIRERAEQYNEVTGEFEEYLNVQGNNYTIERLMPAPFKLQFNADIWTTNTDQKLQLLEQILVLFNPSIEIQSNSNYIDWTSLSLVELTGVTFSSRSIPQGVEQDIDIATLQFDTPIWLTTPAKVKKLGVITKIITSILDEPQGESGSIITDGEFLSTISPTTTVVTTLKDYSLLILDNTAKLIPPGSDGSRCANWYSVLDQYPGKFTADYSSVRITKDNGNEMVGYLAQDPNDDTVMLIRWDPDTRTADTLITSAAWPSGYGRVDAIINPQTFNPGTPAAGVRYLILEDITATVANGPGAWRNNNSTDFTAAANDIIEWDGVQWVVIFNSHEVLDPVYITNQRTLMQYAWNGETWLRSIGGVYTNDQWRLVL